jgi:hypothetical protein
LGTIWIGFCKVQIFIMDGEDERQHLMIGWRNQYNELVATDLLRHHVQNMAEAYGAADQEGGAPPYGGSSSAAAECPWVTNDVGTDWQDAGSAEEVSTAVPSGAWCSSTSEADQVVLPAVAEGDEFEDAQSEAASLGAGVPSVVGGAVGSALATPAVETEAERRRRLAAEAAMRRGS